MPILSITAFAPLLGMLIIGLIPKAKENLIRWTALIATFPSLLGAVKIFMDFDRSSAAIQFQEGPFNWIPAFNIQYYFGLDGLSVTMVILTALISTICILASWKVTKQIKGYFALFLLLETGMMGTFMALDFFLFFVFWEIMLLPMYFLIGIWGGARREYAAIKFFLYTMFGSVLMMLVMVALYLNIGTFNMVAMQDQALIMSEFSHWARTLCWLGLFVGFAVKVPVFPFHTWLPDAHVEAPTAISVILAGVLLKMGTYGILRFNFQIFPDITVEMAKWLAVLGVINIVYGALCAMAQRDFKKLIAYSSVSHMGFVLLGMASFTSEGLNGAVLQMFNHGTITAQLFLIVGILYDRAHHREINGFGGMSSIMPRYAVWTTIAFFAAIGLPGLSGFISEALIFLGSFQQWPLLTTVAVSSVVLSAAYMLWTLQRVYLGKINEKYKDFPDISAREAFCLFPLALIVLVLGVYPKPILNMMMTSLDNINQVLGQHGAPLLTTFLNK
ncbi:MAG: NADH-quinone oxidoreductase subunit M [Deltaproteobacteria bacterium]|nr:NADH-quinone oxidoreductase subunit M [Deltaproteobacteria bacterium]